MEIVDLRPEYEPEYFRCLRPPTAALAGAESHKEQWFRRAQGRGLDVKLAITDDGSVVGMIQVVAVEASWLEGRGVDVVLCTWVHGHSDGVGNHQGHGIGTALLEAASAASRGRGRLGLAVVASARPAGLRAEWYERRGWRVVERRDEVVLLFEPFSDDVVPPALPARRPAAPAPDDGAVVVTAEVNGWCPRASVAAERARCACAGFPPDRVRLEVRPTDGPDALLVGGREVEAADVTVDGLERRIERALRGPWWRRWVRRST